MKFTDTNEEESELLSALQEHLHAAITTFLKERQVAVIPVQLIAGTLAAMAGNAYKRETSKADLACCFVLVNAMMGYGRPDIAREVSRDYERQANAKPANDDDALPVDPYDRDDRVIDLTDNINFPGRGRKFDA